MTQQYEMPPLPKLPMNDPAAAHKILNDYGKACARAAVAADRKRNDNWRHAVMCAISHNDYETDAPRRVQQALRLLSDAFHGLPFRESIIDDLIADRKRRGEPVDTDLVQRWQREHGVVLTPGTREATMVVIRHDEDGKPTVWCDPEIADLVRALNDGGVATVASCSGHGHRPGNIMLADGRVLVVCKDADEAREVASHFPGINGEAPQPAEPAKVPSDEDILKVFSEWAENKEEGARFIDVEEGNAIDIARTLLARYGSKS